MALVRFAEGQQRSGGIGGSVYSHNRSGAYIRARSIPVNPNTNRQVTARNITRNLAIYWGTGLTEAQRDLWDVVASIILWQNKLGESIKLTGINWFIRTSAPRILAGLSQINDASEVLALASAEWDLAATGSEGTQLLSVSFDDTADWCDEADAGELVYMGIPQGPARDFFGGPWRYAGIILGDAVTPPTSPQTIVAPFGMQETQKVWVQTRISRGDGRLSQFAQTTFLCAA